MYTSLGLLLHLNYFMSNSIYFQGGAFLVLSKICLIVMLFYGVKIS